MTIKHYGQHDESCFPCKIKSISFSGAAMPTRNAEISNIIRKEKDLARDMTAFKAMREQGIQPGKLTGAAELQDKATTRREIETGKLLHPKIAKRVESAVKEIAK